LKISESDRKNHCDQSEVSRQVENISQENPESIDNTDYDKNIYEPVEEVSRQVKNISRENSESIDNMDYEKNVYEPIGEVSLNDPQSIVDDYTLKKFEFISNEHNRKDHGDINDPEKEVAMENCTSMDSKNYDKSVCEPTKKVSIDDSQPMVDSYHLKKL